jgi:Heavy metal associated domain 2
MTKLNLKVAHQVPGRIRLKVGSGKGNEELLRQIAETFGVIPGIEHVTVKPATGSIVLHYDVDRHDEFHGMFSQHYQAHAPSRPPATELDELAHRIEDEAEFLAKHSETARVLVDFVKKCDHHFKTATNNTMDLKIVLAGGIIAFTLLEVGATAATPVWVTLAVFTLNHFIEMQPHQPADAHPQAAPIKIKS